MPGEFGISGHSSISNAFASLPAVATEATPEQHFANHLQEHYGMQAEQHNQQALCHQSHHFAESHGMGDQAGMAQLNALVQNLMAEIKFLKGEGEPPTSKEEEAGAKHLEDKKNHQAQMTRLQEKAEMKAEMKELQAKIKAENEINDWILQNL